MRIPVSLNAWLAGLAGVRRVDGRRGGTQDESFRLLVDTVKDYAVFLLDPEGRVMSWNAGAEHIKGYRAAEILGRHFSIFYPHDAIAAGWPAKELEIAARDGRCEDEGWRLRKDGTRFWANVVITALRRPDGSLHAFAKVTRDLTERRRSEDELRRAHAELELRVAERTAELGRINRALSEENEARLRLERELRERLEDLARADREKDAFLATLSHELRTPLNAIVGWVHMLNAGGLDEATTRRAVDSIGRSAQAQSRLISDMLDIQRISSGRLRLNLRPTDPVAVVEAAVDTVRPLAAAQGIVIDLETDCETSDPTLADADRLQQVAWNLLSNAVKFSPREGRIRVGLQCRKAAIDLVVEDQGPGIEPEFLPYVFERFRQGSSLATRKHGGLGLGLAIVRRLVELHAGTVEAANRPAGAGAVFRVHLPRLEVPGGATADSARSAAAPSSGATDLPPEASNAHGVRVLVVEDDPDSREMVVSLLERNGADVVAACSVDDGIALVGKEFPHVILSDIEMPGEDGYTFVERLRSLPPHAGGRTPVVALTAHASVEDRARTMAAGFERHLAKPVRPAELLAVVGELAKAPASPTD